MIGVFLSSILPVAVSIPELESQRWISDRILSALNLKLGLPVCVHCYFKKKKKTAWDFGGVFKAQYAVNETG